MNSLRKSC